MKILSYEKSKDLLIKLFSKLGRKNFEVIDAFLSKGPLNLGLFVLSRLNLPNLWYPQRKWDKNVQEVYEAAVLFDHSKINFYQGLLPLMVKFFNDQGVDSLYSVGDWATTDITLKRVRQGAPRELIETTKATLSESYHFAEDLSWLFVVTHDNFSFLAGSNKFITEFKDAQPNYIDFALENIFIDGKEEE